MEVIKLGKKGQVSIPKAILQRLGLEGETMLLVEATAEGGIIVLPAGVYPLTSLVLALILVLLSRVGVS